MALSGRFETSNGVYVIWELAPSHAAQRAEDRRAGSHRTVSRRLLRTELAARLALSFELVQHCPACGSDAHGPVRVVLGDPDTLTPPPLVGVSYSGPLTVVAIAPPGSSAFGIDVEFDSAQTRAAVNEALAASAGGQEWVVGDWTRLEAVAKARGRGLRGEWEVQDLGHLDCVDVSLDVSVEVGSAILSIALG